ncbi:MAG: hypothetical protein EA416_17540 [Trueperaceae bacterium]|nr:MAG: hypothetical protein EA416_17540 [Trueperaceae bacterium]
MSPSATASPIDRARLVLGAWLPGRAAKQLLDRIVRAEGLEPDAVDGERLASLVLGPVYRELRYTVPRETLRRELKRLARSLHDRKATPPRPLPVATEQPEPPPPRRLPDDPGVVLMALAVLDGVDGAAVFDRVGRPLDRRGEVPDAEGFGRVLAAGGSLLARHGSVRSVAVANDDGVLLAVPVSERWVAVRGSADMNLGAVYAALTALEEER